MPKTPILRWTALLGAVLLVLLLPRLLLGPSLEAVKVARKDLERVQAEFTALGNDAVLSEDLLNWGLVAKQTTFLPDGKVTAVTGADAETTTAMWQLPDRVLLAVRNTAKTAKTVTLDVNLDQLNLTPQLPWQEFIRVRDFTVGADSKLDFPGRKLTVSLPAGGLRLVGLRRY